MKRIFAILGLAQMALLFTLAPVASAADAMNMGICNFGKFGFVGDSTSATGEELASALNDKKVILEGVYEAEDYTAATCGTANSITGMVEKGDCTGVVVSEVAEVVSSATPSTDSSADRIVNLYQGVCCALYSPENICYMTRTYYTADMATCKTYEAGTGTTLPEGKTNCSLRQWIIASTGMGLLKIYVKQIFTFGSMIVGAIAVGNIILNGIRISMAGVSGDISEAKQKITQSLSGIVLLFLSALILYSINPDFFG